MMGGERRLLNALNRAYPNAVPMAVLVDEIYGYDRNGGPNCPETVIRQYILRLRHHLPRYGWTIPHSGGGNGRPGRYRLEPVA